MSGIELPVETECFNSESQVGDPVKTERDVPDLGDPMTMWIYRQGHLPIFGDSIERDVRVEVIGRFLAFTPDHIILIHGTGVPVIWIMSIIDGKLVGLARNEDAGKRIGEYCSTRTFKVFHTQLFEVISEGCFTGDVAQCLGN
jgi:hypothetical protein